MPICLIGRGSNLLAPDEGLPGITVVTTRLNGLEWDDQRVKVEAGYSLIRLAQEAGERGLSGLEFACGIPGTLGGAVIMNAGAHGGQISNLLTKVRVLTKAGEIVEFKRDQLYFAYRHCSLRDKAWVLEAEISLLQGEKKEILEAMKANLKKRADNQPLNMPNAGSVFRNPEGDSAGRLIELAGWKGQSIGGAMVSEKHANFIVNTGEAKAQDILKLIQKIREDIKSKYKVELIPEVRILSAD